MRFEADRLSAEVWLQPPQELIRFLEEWLRVSGGKYEA